MTTRRPLAKCRRAALLTRTHAHNASKNGRLMSSFRTLTLFFNPFFQAPSRQSRHIRIIKNWSFTGSPTEANCDPQPKHTAVPDRSKLQSPSKENCGAQPMLIAVPNRSKLWSLTKANCDPQQRRITVPKLS